MGDLRNPPISHRLEVTRFGSRYLWFDKKIHYYIIPSNARMVQMFVLIYFILLTPSDSHLTAQLCQLPMYQDHLP